MSSNPWLQAYRPLSIAHRGHSTAYPENTLEAFRKAIELGVEMIECDVNITRDGKLVMLHDSTLDRTTTGTGRVSASTWEEIQQLDAGGKFDPQFAGVRVPSTEGTLLLYKEAGILSCFEVKGADGDESDRIALGLLELFIKHSMLDKAFMSSYHHEALQLAQSKCPELLLAPERLPDDARDEAWHAIGDVRATQSRRIVDRIREWAYAQRCTPESGLRKAIDYMLGLWGGLTRFLDDPRVPLTNNLAERAFRFVRQRQRPMGAFTNEQSAERIFGALGGEWNRRRSHPLEAIYTT